MARVIMRINMSVAAADQSESNCMLHLCFQQVLANSRSFLRYQYGRTRAAALELRSIIGLQAYKE